MNSNVIFYQLYEPESSTYTYIIADRATKQAAIIDPVLETVERDLKLIQELDLKLKYILETHIHADHITGAGKIRQSTHAQIGLSHTAGATSADLPLKNNDELLLGNLKIKVLETPGHTNTCLSFVTENSVFTGDTLLIRGTGRTDFQQGSSELLYKSITEKLFTLPDETLVYPGHDYKGQTASTIAMEKKWNPRIGGNRSLAEFQQIMAELKLTPPKKIHEAVPANLVCGIVNTSTLS